MEDLASVSIITEDLFVKSVIYNSSGDPSCVNIIDKNLFVFFVRVLASVNTVVDDMSVGNVVQNNVEDLQSAIMIVEDPTAKFVASDNAGDQISVNMNVGGLNVKNVEGLASVNTTELNLPVEIAEDRQYANMIVGDMNAESVDQRVFVYMRY